MKARVHECSDLRGLARAIIAQAVRDLKDRDPVKKVDALLWLAGGDFEVWSEAMNAPFMDPYKMLSGGGAKKIRGRV